MKQNKMKIYISRSQAKLVQILNHWGRGKCLWSTPSWNGMEFERAMLTADDDFVKKFNNFCEQNGFTEMKIIVE